MTKEEAMQKVREYLLMTTKMATKPIFQIEVEE